MRLACQAMKSPSRLKEWSKGGNDRIVNKATSVISASSITACSRNLPEPEACLINEVTKLRPMLSHGDLGDGFKTPPLEPLLLKDTIQWKRGKEFSASFSDLLVSGPGQFSVEKLR